MALGYFHYTGLLMTLKFLATISPLSKAPRQSSLSGRLCYGVR